MAELRAPSVLVSWTATALANFKAYRVYRRAARAAVLPWARIAELAVPTGYTAATVQAQHTSFVDYGVGGTVAGAQWADGWDYTVTVVDSVTGVESNVGTPDLRNQVTPDPLWWLTSNANPYLNMPLLAEEVGSGDSPRIRKFDVSGRDHVVTRTPLELPYRTLDVKFRLDRRLGQDALRNWRAAASLGVQTALVGPRGDLILGVPEAPGSIDHQATGLLIAGAQYVETTRAPVAAGHNRPAGLVLNGTTQRVTHPDTGNLLDPAASAFSVVMCADFSALAANAYALAKLSAGDGYAFRRDAGANFQWFVDGVTTSGGPVEAIANWTGLRVAVGTSSGAAQILYRDGVNVAQTAVTHGAVANADVLSIGARSDAANWSAMAPAQAWAVYMRELTPAEALSASYYLLGYPGYRMPGGAQLFVDLRDVRTWPGYGTTLNDLSGEPLEIGTLVATPATRGVPWALSLLDKF